MKKRQQPHTTQTPSVASPTLSAGEKVHEASLLSDAGGKLLVSANKMAKSGKIEKFREETNKAIENYNEAIKLLLEVSESAENSQILKDRAMGFLNVCYYNMYRCYNELVNWLPQTPPPSRNKHIQGRLEIIAYIEKTLFYLDKVPPKILRPDEQEEPDKNKHKLIEHSLKLIKTLAVNMPKKNATGLTQIIQLSERVVVVAEELRSSNSKFSGELAKEEDVVRYHRDLATHCMQLAHNLEKEHNKDEAAKLYGKAKFHLLRL